MRADFPVPWQVFDDKGAFNDWFGEALGGGDTDSSSDWLQEKRVVVIHRLHQILEPFMLRRQVQDVEGSLPEKVPNFPFPSSRPASIRSGAPSAGPRCGGSGATTIIRSWSCVLVKLLPLQLL